MNIQIQRRYGSNCTLTLDGLGDRLSSLGSSDRPPLSILLNVACQLPGQASPLLGGRDLLEHLVVAVSSYAQRYLSGVPVQHHQQTPLVSIDPVGTKAHRLAIQPILLQPYQPSTPLLEVELNTTQLFELVEAVDQFLQDNQTLPDLALQVTPVSRREAVIHRPITQQIVAFISGLSTLAITATVLFFFIPAPKPIQNLGQKITTANNLPINGINPTNSPSPQSTPSPSPVTTSSSDPSGIFETGTEIEEPQEVERLWDIVYENINRDWRITPTFEEELVYRVAVGSDGTLLGFKGVNAAAENETYMKETPLLDLLKIPPTGGTNPEIVNAQFKVVFKPNGVLEINPWRGSAQ